MDENERAIRRKLRDDFKHYASKCLKITSKKCDGDLVPFEFNTAQIVVHQKIEEQKLRLGYVRAVILKGRQEGISTYVTGRYYHQATHRFGVRVFILTHVEQATNNLFDMVKRYHKNCPAPVKPTTKASNATELIFAGLDSGYKLGTAGNKSVGRSSTIHFLHGSEVALWPNAGEIAQGLMEAVPTEKGTEIILESTAKGSGNFFHTQWQSAEIGESDFIPIFVPWYLMNEYRREVPEQMVLSFEEEELKNIYHLDNEQLIWRRDKINSFYRSGLNGDIAFKEEYPFNPTEAFQTSGDDILISSTNVVRARNAKNIEPYGQLILGVDPARMGDDRTSIIRRRGRVAYGLESHSKKNNMEVAGIIHRIILEEDPKFVFIDLGGGSGIIDRLNELGHREKIKEVNFGSTALNQKIYSNKRAEMWGEMAKWLEDGEVKIPDSNSLHADLCAPKYKHDSNSRLIIEKKEEMKKRGIRSPDEGDALALTFAYPAATLEKNVAKENEIASTILSQFNKVNQARSRRKW